MSVYRRAWLSISRRSGKSLLLLAVVAILGTAMAGAVSVREAASLSESTIRHAMGAEASFQLDHDAFNAFFQEHLNDPDAWEGVRPPSVEIIEAAGKSRYVKVYDYSLIVSAGSKVLERYVHPAVREQEGNTEASWQKYYAFFLNGVQYPGLLSIDRGEVELVEGRTFTPEEIEQGPYTAILTKTLAELNSISVGDTISLVYYVHDDQNPASHFLGEIDLPVQVVGLVEPIITPKEAVKARELTGAAKYEYGSAKQMEINTIYVPNRIVADMTDQALQMNIEAHPDFDPAGRIQLLSPMFLLHRPEDLESFKEETDPILPRFYSVSTVADQFSAIAAPVEQTSRLAGLFFLAAAGISVLLITLVLLLFLRERRQELGIYLSLGETKRRLIQQMLAEVLLIALAGLLLSSIAGNFLAAGISDALIQTQIQKIQEAEEADPPAIRQTAPIEEFTTEDVIEAYAVRLSPSFLLKFFAAGLGTLFLSTLLPLCSILRLRPKNILTEQ